MVHILGASAPTVQGRAKARVDISFLDVNADDDLSFYSVNRDRQGNALINLAASQRRHNELMSPHIRKMKEVRRALNKRVPTAGTLARKPHKCDPTILPFASAAEQMASEEGHARLLDNFDRHHTQRHRTRAHSSLQLAQPAAEVPDALLPREATLLFEKFKVVYPLRAINEKEYINPAYYDTEGGLDLRAAGSTRRDAPVDYGSGGLLLSAFNNAETQVVLKKSSNDNKPNMYTNTRSFAAKYGRMAPKHRVKRATKEARDMPQVGYYDVKTALQDPRVRSVRMEKDLPRDSKMLHGGKAPDRNAWAALDEQKVQNLWTKSRTAQAHMDYKTQLSRAQCTKKIGEREGVWLFSKTQKDIQRKEKEKAASELAVARVLQKNSQAAEPAEDKTEHQEKKFTCDMTKIGSVKAHYLNGLEMLRENIHKELEQDDKDNKR